MNRRVQELAQQCWDERLEGQLHFDNEKFAGLIIRECANVIHTRIGPKSALDVLEHFGVE